MLIPFLLICLGFVLVIKGADWLVTGSSSIARRMNVPDIVIGLTLISFGTSAPELIVGLTAAFKGYNEIVIGNIVGSNNVNIMLGLGTASLVCSLIVRDHTVWKEIPFSLAGAVLLLLLANDFFLAPAGQTTFFSRIDATLMLVAFAGFIAYVYWLSKKHIMDAADEHREKESVRGSVIHITLGMVGLFWGGNLVVDSSVELAQGFGVSQKLIALTIVAAGTSLPEIVTSVVAAWKGKSDIAVGNIIGSNIFNILLILGTSAMVRPIAYNHALNIDEYVLLACTTLLFVTMFTGKRHALERWEGILLITSYIGYCAFLIIRG